MSVRYGQPTREVASIFVKEAKGLSISELLGCIDATPHAHIHCRSADHQALQEIVVGARDLVILTGRRGAIAINLPRQTKPWELLTLGEIA
jgi:hypothetical protein